MRTLESNREKNLTVIRAGLETLPPTRRPFGASAIEATHEAFYDADLSSTLALIELWWDGLVHHYQQFQAQPWLTEVNIVNPTLAWALYTDDGILEIHATVAHAGESSALPWGWVYVRRRNQKSFRICISTYAYISDTVRFLRTLAETPESEVHKVFEGDPSVRVISDDTLKVAYQEGGSATYYTEEEEGVRAKIRSRPAHDEPKRCTFISPAPPLPPPLRRARPSGG